MRQGCGGDRNPEGVAEAREGGRGEAQTVKNRGKAVYICIMGRKQVNPRWADDLVRRNVSGGRILEGGGCPPQKNIRRRKERLRGFK